VIASTHRAYTTAEKMSGADGRVDAGRVAGAIRALARRAVLVDLEAIRAAHATVISAPLFGALVGSGAVPLSRAAAEAAIRAAGRGVEASLAAFAPAHAAAAAAAGPTGVPSHPAGAAGVPVLPGTAASAAGVPVLPATVAGAAGATLPETVARRLRELPEPVAGIARVGAARLVGYQDAAWAASYVDRVARIAKRDLPTAAIVARHLAHWMSYEDAIRVAAIKARRVRLARIRAEASAAPGDVVRVREMFAPGIDEIAAVLPAPLGAWLERRAARPAGPRRGLSLETSAPAGALALRVMAGLSRWRRRSLRFGREQAAIEAWLAALEHALGVAGGQRAAHELAALPALRRGYGATQQRGVAHYDRIFAAFAAQLDGDPAAAAEALAQARDAALAAPDPPVPPARPQPVRFVGTRSR
jgi:indolepyruvate ferredoxin oxidoreductase beta subunit